MIVVADSSPLRYLIAIGKHGLLPALFGETWIPTKVVEELSVGATPAVVQDFLAHRPEWLRVRDPGPEAVASISAELDAGERAALALARELRADLVLMDDAAGRREARALQLRMTGTLGVLRLAAERNLIDVPSVIASIRESGLYLEEGLIRLTFDRWI